MKSIIKLIFFLICSLSFAQSFDTDYQAILNEATTNGYTLPSTADQNIQNQIIVNAKANGIWANSDLILYFKGSGDKNFKLINWKNPTETKASEEAYGGALTWTATGVKGDGLAVINTHFNPTATGLNYTQNDAGFYAKISEAYTNAFTVSSGSNISLSTTFQRPRINSTGLAPVFTFPVTGLLGVSRNSNTSHIVSIGTVLTTQTHASDVIVSEDISVLGNAHSSAITSHTRFDGEVAYVIIGGDMTDKLSDMETAFDSTSSGDTQSPTVSTLSSTSQTDTTVDLSWTAATDNVAVTGYKVYKDGVLESTLGNVLTYQVTGLTTSTSYDFTLTALDSVGNESSSSNPVTITTNAPSGGGSGYWSLNNQDVYYTNGNVGIGTSAPDSKLTVKGSIHSEEVKVDLSVPAPDYVFKSNYSLTPLKDLQEYIRIHGHLPNIPSAKEMETNGIELGIMNMKLLEKIEELTLYILKQQEALKGQALKNEIFEKQLMELKKIINSLKK